MRRFILAVVIAACVLAGQNAMGYEKLAPDVWHVRVTNPADSPERLCVRVYVNPISPPGGGDTIYIAQGGEQTSIPAKEYWLVPGQSSDWTDIGVHMPVKTPETNDLVGVFFGAMYKPFVEYEGLVRIDSVADTCEQVSATLYTDLGSANRNAQKYMFGARPGGGVDEIDGTSGTWTFTSINNNAYTRVVGYRGASDKVFGAKATGGLDYMTKTAGVWTTTNIADAGTRRFSDLSPESLQAMMFASPETAADYFNGTNSGMEVFNPGLVGLYQSNNIYTDLAYGNYYYECYGAGPGGLDYTSWGGVGVPEHINDTVYNSITSAENPSWAQTVYGAKAGGGVTKSYKDGGGVWQTVDLVKPGSTEYSILWKCWGGVGSDNNYLFAAGKNGGLWRLDTADVDDPRLLSSNLFTSLVGNRENGVIYGVCTAIGSSPLASEATGLRLVVELARGPGKELVREVDVSDPNPTLFGVGVMLNTEPKLPTQGFLIPLDPYGPHHIWTLEETAQAQLDSIGYTPGSPYEQCKYMWFQSLVNMGRDYHEKANFKNPSVLESMDIEIAARLGYNNLTQYAKDAEDIGIIQSMGIGPARGTSMWYGLRSFFTSVEQFAPFLQAEASRLTAAGLIDYVRMINMGDEYNVQVMFASPAEQDAAFVAHLKQKGFTTPWDFIRPADEAAAQGLPVEEQWNHVHLGTSARFGGDMDLALKPKLLYESYVFRYQLWTQENAQFTEAVKQYFPSGTETGINFTPDGNWPDVPRFINMVRDGGMTVPWSEDWWALNSTPVQDYGFMFAALRHAADYNNAPVSFYTIPLVPANDLLRMNYYALGNQVKFINHYTLFHQAYGHHGLYLDFMQSLSTYPVIRRITSDVAQIDELLYKARMRPAEVAILMLEATDAWDWEDVVDNLGNSPTMVNIWDRKSLYLALRHSNIPVDIITDADVAAGGLSNYKVIYLTGQHLLSESVPNLTQWVNDGGILVSSGGGGLLNQHGEPMSAMYSLYGLESATLARPIRVIAGLGGYSYSLETMTPLDTMTIPAVPGQGTVNIPVLCYKHTMVPNAQASVIATYSNGSPAGVERSVGQGKAVLLGGLMGLAYLRPAMNWIPESPDAQKYDRYPETYPLDVRGLISSWAKAALVDRHVITSDPLVDATLQEGPLGAVVTLTNFGKSDIPELTVSIPGLPEVQTIRSLRHGYLTVSQGPNGPTVSLPIDQGDFLVASVTASLTVHVNFRDYTPVFDPPVAVSVELFETGNPVAVRTEKLILDANDECLLQGIPEGNYEVAAKASHFLRKKLPVTIVGSEAYALTFELVNGDADGDNQVGNTDINIVLPNLDDVGDL